MFRLQSPDRGNGRGNTIVVAECEGICEREPDERLHYKGDDDAACEHCGVVRPSVWTDREAYWGTVLHSCRYA